MSMSPKWHLAYLVPIDSHFRQIGRYWVQIFLEALIKKLVTISMCKINIYIYSDATLATLTLFVHNLVIFHPILTLFFINACFLKTNRMVTITKLYIFFSSDFGFCPIFCSKASHGQYCTYGPKTTLKMLGRVLAFPTGPPTLPRNTFFQSDRPEPFPLK